MKWWHALTMVFCWMSNGCATMQTGEPAVPLTAEGKLAPAGSGPVVVFSRELEDVSSSHLPVIEVSFENHTTEWHKVTATQIIVDDDERPGSVKIPLNEDLHDWRVATGQRRAVDDANRETAIELVTAGGLIVADAGSESKNKNVRIGTAIVGLLAASAGLAMHYSDRKHDAERLPLLASNHLLAGPISLAPLTITKRWVLLYTPYHENTDELRVGLSYDLAKYGTQRVLLRSTQKSKSKRDRHGG